MDFHIGEHWVVNILGLNVHMDTLITMWTVMLLIILLSLIAVLNLKVWRFAAASCPFPAAIRATALQNPS